MVLNDHGNGITTLYGHMSRFSRNARGGQSVGQGEVIGYVGSTGASTGPHLHYEYRVRGVHKNPAKVIMPRTELPPPTAPSSNGSGCAHGPAEPGRAAPERPAYASN